MKELWLSLKEEAQRRRLEKSIPLLTFWWLENARDCKSNLKLQSRWHKSWRKTRDGEGISFRWEGAEKEPKRKKQRLTFKSYVVAIPIARLGPKLKWLYMDLKEHGGLVCLWSEPWLIFRMRLVPPVGRQEGADQDAAAAEEQRRRLPGVAGALQTGAALHERRPAERQEGDGARQLHRQQGHRQREAARRALLSHLQPDVEERRRDGRRPRLDPHDQLSLGLPSLARPLQIPP